MPVDPRAAEIRPLRRMFAPPVVPCGGLVTQPPQVILVHIRSLGADSATVKHHFCASAQKSRARPTTQNSDHTTPPEWRRRTKPRLARPALTTFPGALRWQWQPSIGSSRTSSVLSAAYIRETPQQDVGSRVSQMDSRTLWRLRPRSRTQVFCARPHRASGSFPPVKNKMSARMKQPTAIGRSHSSMPCACFSTGWAVKSE